MREDLEEALRNQVNGILGKLQKPDHVSDSSGFENDDWYDHWELKEVRASARLREKERENLK